ncbi:hypothetical protein [Acinetobacter tibetensis]|uniref:Iron-containing redox enzyme family protein n=1 Tax=Acinetobacter tibetensis TaxID=2943497 RepID=A0AAE9LPG7_9GAMM|nr:hypothetical protein [Acinetobacter tibetensis]USE82289.1 hypothetical protein M5E07_10750 [Acinetobacter tibetensis]
MSTLAFTQSENARLEALNFIRHSVEPSLWHRHIEQVNTLKQYSLQHPLFQQKILERLHNQALSLEQLKLIHINYFAAIVKVFTDALSMLIYQAYQLEQHPNIHRQQRIHAKAYARYLLSLNLIDELGFNTYQLPLSSPSKSHLVYFMELLQALEIDPFNEQEVCNEAYELDQFIQSHLDSYEHLLLILACAELQVIKYSEALRINLEKYDSRLTEGYYDCHGIVDHTNRLANDDNHEDDIWSLFTQSYQGIQSNEYQTVVQEYLDLWAKFWNKMHLLST